MVAYVRSGSEFVVNTTTARSQAQSDGTRLSNGNFIITWIDADFNTTSGRFVRAQIFQPDGTPVGSEMTLATSNFGGSSPSIVGLANGGFVVTWTVLGSLNAQAYDANGTPTGSVLTVASNSASFPDVTALSNGGFAIVWHDSRTTGGDVSGSAVRVSNYDENGAPVGSQVLVNTSTSGNQADASAAALSSGSYVVTWTDRGAPGNGSSLIKAQIFDASGAKNGPEFLVNSTNAGVSSVESSVTTLTNGNFAVAWHESVSGGASGHRIQIFTAAGVVIGSQISVPSSFDGIQAGPVLTALSDGGFVLGWKANYGTQFDGSGSGIFVQVFDANANPVGGPELVNTQLGGDQVLPSILALADGGFVVNWTDLNAPGADNDSVRAQIFMPDTASSPATEVVITSGGGGTVADVFAFENETAVTFVRATPAATSPSILYTITGGDDAARFTIDSNSGLVRFVSAPDFEAPADQNGDNSYQIVVTATDGTLSDSQTINVIVPDLNEGPVITSASSFVVSENSLTAATISAADTEGDAFTYSIVGGAEALGYSTAAYYDSTKFLINSTTGAVTFSNAPNFEAPADYGSDGTYDLLVRATDANGSVSAIQAVTITVTNVNEGTIITSNGGGATAAFSINENQNLATTVVARDNTGPSITYSISGGFDASKFTISASTGVLTFNTAANYETPNDFGLNRVYDVTVAATDGLVTDTQALAITVNNVNEPFSITSHGGGDTGSFSVDENYGTSLGIAISTNDPEGGPLVYSIVGGADAARFTLTASGVSNIGSLKFVSSPNFEAPADANGDNIYDVVISVSDGTFSDTQALAINIINVNEAVAITSNGAGSTSSISIAENQTAVTNVTAVDPESAALTYSISGGADAAKFAIDAATGALRFVSAPNFEVRTDVGANNVYDVVVRATDGVTSDTQALAITITNVNEAPVITSNGGGDTAGVTVSENLTAITTVSSTDPENTARTYSIAGGVDAASFTINAATGALSFVGGRNFEAPTDADANNIYDVIVRASDSTLADTQAIAVTVTNVNETVSITSGSGYVLAENSSTIGSVTAVDLDGTAPTYSISGGADAALFAINAATGALSFVGAPDFEAAADAGADNIYNVTVRASDGVLSDTRALTVTVTDQNEPVVITSNGGGSSAALSIAESSPAVTTVTATDPENTTRTYAIAGGADASLFTIDAATGMLSFVAAPSYEAPADADADNVFDVTVSASDGVNIDTQMLAITVINMNEGLSFTTGAAFGVLENSTAIATVSATDIDGDAVTYSISGGADAALFVIDEATGALSFVSAPNFEAPGDEGVNNVYEVTISATDGSLTASSAIAVTVGNANEGVSISSGAAFSIGENSAAIADVVATDVDSDIVTYAIAGGADAALFAIDAVTGALSFVATPDFEVPGDAGADNVYDLIVSATDGSFVDTKALKVAVGNANEGVLITSAAAFDVSENATAVGTVSAADIDGDAVTYAIAGGADAALFAINATTGALSFVSAPNFEAPGDAGANNIYDVTVSASDGILSDTQAIAVSVGNINEGLSITSGSSFSVAENQTIAATISAIDVDGTAPTYAIAGGVDAAKFTINATTGVLQFIAAPNFEAPTDAGNNNVYDVVVSATDGGFVETQAIAVTVANINEAVTITSNGAGDNAAISVSENLTAATTVAGSDIDGDAVSYSIAGGADAAKFTINATTGALQFIAAPNFEAPTDSGANNVYDVIVAATDGVFSDTQAIAVTVGNVSEAVTITSNGAGATASINAGENGVAVGSIAAIDPDGNAVSYSLAGGADAAKFAINATTGALQFIAAPNFEAPTDTGANNVYDVVVSATDGSSVDTQAIAVTVTNVNEAVAITSNGAGNNAAISVNENISAVTTVAASDIDGSAVSYRISGGADAAKFAINATTGALQFNAMPNFEAPTDVGANNVYDVIVAATDGVLTDTQAIAVTINNIVDGANITGTAGVDTISNTATLAQFRSTNAEDTINTLAGADTISGGGGDDVINSGDGNDTIQYSGVTEGFDRVDGGVGTDTIVALANNTVIGLASIAGVESISAGSFTGVSISGSAAADTLNFASTTLTGITKIDGGAGNDNITGTTAAATLAGGAGDDTLTGRNGNDIFLFSGTNDGFDAITGGSGTDTIRANANNTIIGLRSLATIEAITAGSFTGVSISGSSAADTLNFSSVALTGITQIDGGAGNDAITGSAGADTLVGGLGNDSLSGGNGVDTVDYSYSASNWTINLAATSAQAVSGAEIDTITTVENVIGGSSNDTITGTTGNNILKGGAGADRISGGLGNDTLDGGLGIDVAVYAGLQASYSLTTLNGVVTIVDNQTNVDGNDGTDTLVGFETVEFKGGTQVALALPIVLDLNGDGVTLISQLSSTARFDWNADGTRDKTGWVGANDGILFFDRDGNGTVSGADELSFVNDKLGAKSDLDGLSAFDSNGDGQFSSLDGKWSEFRIWQDRNSDGAVDAGELRSLADAGVSSINLAGQAVNRTWNWNDNLTLNNGLFTRTDGSKGQLADVALNYQSGTQGAAAVDSIGILPEIDMLRSRIGAESGGLRSYFNLPTDVDAFDYFGSSETPPTPQSVPHGRVPAGAGDITRRALDACVNLMRQDMASFGVRNGEGEGEFGSRREPQARYDYFA